MTEDLSVDVLVVGGGNAALCAAISAREAGATVALLEAAPEPFRGGNSRHTRDIRFAHPGASAYVTGPYAEEEFWDVVRRAVRAHAARVPEFAARLSTFDVFAPRIEVEKLTTRRLWPDTELRVHALPNPLCERNSQL